MNEEQARQKAIKILDKFEEVTNYEVLEENYWKLSDYIESKLMEEKQETKENITKVTFSDLDNVKVKNMRSSSGNDIANQFIITVGDKEYFQSYSSIIAVKHNGRVALDKTYWAYSTTTGKYRNKFLGEDKKETKKKIKSGEYELIDLN